MIAMQYNIVFPSDYDMQIIKRRVQDNGNKTDGFLDLKMKAYLVAEKSRFNNYENQYAPFYLWEKADGMNKFLLTGYFNNILNSFGWTQVNNWIVLHQYVSNSMKRQYVTVKRIMLPKFTDVTDIVKQEQNLFTNRMGQSSTTALVTAYNPLTWEICRYYMTTNVEELHKIADGDLIYDVYHISS